MTGGELSLVPNCWWRVVGGELLAANSPYPVFTTSEHCLLGFKSLEIITPRSFSSSTFANCLPFIV